MVKETVIIHNINGIHCRPSSVIVKAATSFKSTLRVSTAEGEANLKSMIEIITMAMHKGTKVTVFAEGSDEKAALKEMAMLLTKDFEYPDKN